ncbi:MAG: patatin-like phospholipase family protein [Deltaproteobacteria bacterium]|nr:patatin-like phospholipase family protein [Deltaproteobacteria bacterium]
MNIVFVIRLNPSQIKRLKSFYNRLACYETGVTGEYVLSRFSLDVLRKASFDYQVLKSFSIKQLPIEVIYPAQSFLFEPPDSEALEEALAYALSKGLNLRKIQLQYLGRHHSDNPEVFLLDRPGGKRSYRWYIPEKPQKLIDIRQQFPKMMRRLKSKNTKVVLSLGSGGVRLFAHPSLFKFIDLMGLRPYIDEIWGSSGGAIAGLPYSLGVEPHAIEQEGYHLYNERYSFRFSPSKLEVIKNLLSDAFLAASDNMLQGFLDCQQHLESMLEKFLEEKKRKIPFFAMAYNLTKSRSEVLTPEEVDSKIYLTPILQTKAMDAVVASSAIPILYVPKKITRGNQTELYVDGGTTEEVPLISPYRKWKRERKNALEKRPKLLILSVNLFPTVGSSPLFTHWVFKKIPVFKILRLSATYADLVRQARIDEHKGTLARDKQVTQWELKLPDTGSGIVNTKAIPKIIEAARTSFYDQLLAIEASLS